MQTSVQVYNDTGTLLSTDVQKYIPTVINSIVSVTNAEALELLNLGALSPGTFYKITDCTTGPVYVQAITSNSLNPIGYSEIGIAGGTYGEVQYDVNTNQLTRVYDLKYYNWVEGNANIIYFPWGSSHIAYNTIKGGASVNIHSTAASLANHWTNNLFQNCTFTIDSSCNIGNFDGNQFTDGTISLTGLTSTGFINNKIAANITLGGSIDNITNNEIVNTSSFYLTGTITDFIDNVINNGSGISASSITTPSFSKCNINGSSVTITSLNVTDFTDNTIWNSTVTFSATTGVSRFVSNIIKDSEFTTSYETGLVNCNIFAVRAGSDLDTAIIYQYCEYKRGEFSTFYAEYDFSNPAYYVGPSSNMMIVQPQHADIMGIFYVFNNNVDTIDTITNYPTKHKFSIRAKIGNTQTFQIGNAANIIFPQSFSWASLPLAMNTFGGLPADTIIFDGRPDKVGAGGNIYVTDGYIY